MCHLLSVAWLDFPLPLSAHNDFATILVFHEFCPKFYSTYYLLHLTEIDEAIFTSLIAGVTNNRYILSKVKPWLCLRWVHGPEEIDTCNFIIYSEVAQSCPTLCDPMDCSPPGSSIHGIFQARVLEWGAISFYRESSQPRDRTLVSRITGRYHLSHQGSLIMYAKY